MRRSISTTLALALAAGALIAVPAQATSHPVVGFTAAGAGVVRAEGNSGSTSFTFDVRLENPVLTDTVTVDWATEDGTATTADGDYTGASGTLTFLPGQSTPAGGHPTVTVAGDTKPELDNVFRVRLSNPSNASIGRAVATGHILDDDTPTVSISGPADPVAEPASGQTALANFTVTVSPAHTEAPVAVRWRTVDRTATAGEDYTGVTAGTVTVPAVTGAGATATAMLTVTVLGDDAPEGSTPEEFAVELLSATHARVTDSGQRRAVAKIDDGTDGPANVVRVLDAWPEPEGHSSPGGKASFDLVLSDPQAADLDIRVWTAHGTTDPGEFDFEAQDEVRRIQANETHIAVEVQLAPNAIAEGTETFTLNLGEHTGAPVTVARGTAQGTILDDDGPQVTVAAMATATEGDAVVFEVTVGTTPPRTETVTVDVATTDGTARAAQGDYTPVSQTLSFPPGTNTRSVSVPTHADGADEFAESFRLRLSNPQFAKLGTAATGAATIWDADGPPTVRVRDAQVLEGDGGTTPLRFTVELDHPSGKGDVEVRWSTIDGTATEGTDYVKVSGASTVIPKGATTATLIVHIKTNTRQQDNRTFQVELLHATTGATVPDAADGGLATGTIIDDDRARFIVHDTSALEGPLGSGGSPVFSVELLGDSPFRCPDGVRIQECPGPENPFVVQYATKDGTEPGRRAVSTNDEFLNDADYVLTTGTLTFAPNEFEPGQRRIKTVSVPLVGDGAAEASEWFTLEISLPDQGANDFANVQDPSGRGTVVNDDGPVLQIQDSKVVEGDSGTRTAVVSFSYSGSTEGENDSATVRYRTKPSTATNTPAASAGSDYLARSGTVTFVGSGSVEIPIVGDTSEEADEVFLVEFYEPDWVKFEDSAGNSLARKTAKVTIQDDDAPTGGTDGGTTDGTTGGTTGGSDGGTTGGSTDGIGGTGGDDGGPDTGEVFRAFGEGRIETAVAVSADHWPSADAAVLATAGTFPDALAGGALAAGLRGPLLLTPSDQLPEVVADELERLGVREVWILGGTTAVSMAVEEAVEALGIEVIRVAGGDRFETAAKITRSVRLPANGEVVLALGHHAEPDRAWPDALSAGSLAASSSQVPTLLTLATQLPKVTEEALAELGAKRVLVLGGKGAIDDAVVKRLQQLGYEVQRLSGQTRYGTTVAVAEDALARHADGDVIVVFATGEVFADGLSAGALAARFGALVVLVPSQDLAAAPEVSAFLKEHADRFDQAVIVGGPVAVTETVRNQLAQAMKAS